MNNLICIFFGHKDKKYLVDGDGVHLPRCCIIRVKICARCEKWQ